MKSAILAGLFALPLLAGCAQDTMTASNDCASSMKMADEAIMKSTDMKKKEMAMKEMAMAKEMMAQHKDAECVMHAKMAMKIII